MHRVFAIALLLLAAPVQAEVYLCPTDGDGSDANPYRSRALSELLAGRGNTDLRDDVTQPGFMLCESDTLPNDTTGVVVIGTDRSSTIRAGAKADIARDAGMVIRGTTVEDAIKELVIPRLPRPKDGKDYEIILSPKNPPVKEVASLSSDLYYKGLAATVKERGALVAEAVMDGLVPVAHAIALVTETFNCADNAALTCIHPWADKNGTALNIVSNQASASGAVSNDVYANVSLGTTDHEVIVTVVSGAAGGGSTGCSVFGRTTNNTTQTYYRAGVFIDTSTEDFSLLRTVAASTTTLAVDSNPWDNGDVIAIHMIGTTISGWKNNIQVLSVTDSTITTGTYGGMRYSSSGGSASCVFDNWSARDVSTRRKIAPWFN